MKRLLLAGTVLAFGGQAWAAPAAAPVPFVWTGCYVGGHAGIGSGYHEFSDPGHPVGNSVAQNFAPPGGAIGFDTPYRFLGGAQVGCDLQFATNWVFGVAGDVSWTSLNGQTTDPYFNGKNGNPITLTSKTDELATATGRLGYAWEHYMLYGKGGAAWSRDSYTIQNLVDFGGSNCSNGGFPSFVGCNATGSETRLGWVAGFGFEWAFAKSWSALLEFDHYGMGSRSVPFFVPNAGPNGVTNLVDIKQRFDVIKLGINYRLGWAR
jgi:outer membrane immunogenic protein